MKKKPKVKPRRTRIVWLVYADDAAEPFGCGLNLSEATGKIADLAKFSGAMLPLSTNLFARRFST